MHTTTAVFVLATAFLFTFVVVKPRIEAWLDG
jgi:hypothetical protein